MVLLSAVPRSIVALATRKIPQRRGCWQLMSVRACYMAGAREYGYRAPHLELTLLPTIILADLQR